MQLALVSYLLAGITAAAPISEAARSPRSAFERSSSASPASCPTSRLSCQGEVTETATSSGSCANSDDLGGGFASYDAVLGRLDASSSSGGDGFGGAEVMVRDEFIVFGPPAGSTVHLIVELHAQGFAYCGGGGAPGGASARIGSSLDALVTFGFSCDEYPTSGVAAIPVEALVGTAFPMTYLVEIGGSQGGGGGISGQLRFSALPAGASVVSCRGFVQEEPVPVSPATWSRVKAAYR